MPPDARLLRLDRRLRRAHARGDAGALVALYGEAADQSEASGDTDAACFFLTQAYVHALDRIDAAAPALHARLRARGREE